MKSFDENFSMINLLVLKYKLPDEIIILPNGFYIVKEDYREYLLKLMSESEKAEIASIICKWLYSLSPESEARYQHLIYMLSLSNRWSELLDECKSYSICINSVDLIEKKKLLALGRQLSVILTENESTFWTVVKQQEQTSKIMSVLVYADIDANYAHRSCIIVQSLMEEIDYSDPIEKYIWQLFLILWEAFQDKCKNSEQFHDEKVTDNYHKLPFYSEKAKKALYMIDEIQNKMQTCKDSYLLPDFFDFNESDWEHLTIFEFRVLVQFYANRYLLIQQNVKEGILSNKTWKEAFYSLANVLNAGLGENSRLLIDFSKSEEEYLFSLTVSLWKNGFVALKDELLKPYLDREKLFNLLPKVCARPVFKQVMNVIEVQKHECEENNLISDSLKANYNAAEHIERRLMKQDLEDIDENYRELLNNVSEAIRYGEWKNDGSEKKYNQLAFEEYDEMYDEIEYEKTSFASSIVEEFAERYHDKLKFKDYLFKELNGDQFENIIRNLYQIDWGMSRRRKRKLYLWLSSECDRLFMDKPEYSSHQSLIISKYMFLTDNLDSAIKQADNILKDKRKLGIDGYTLMSIMLNLEVKLTLVRIIFRYHRLKKNQLELQTRMSILAFKEYGELIQDGNTANILSIAFSSNHSRWDDYRHKSKKNLEYERQCETYHNLLTSVVKHYKIIDSEHKIENNYFSSDLLW